MLPIAVTIGTILVLCGIAAAIIHFRHPRAKVKRIPTVSEYHPVYEQSEATFTLTPRERTK